MKRLLAIATIGFAHGWAASSAYALTDVAYWATFVALFSAAMVLQQEEPL